MGTNDSSARNGSVREEQRAYREENRERARELRRVLATLDTRDPREAAGLAAGAMMSGDVPREAMGALRSIARGADPGDLDAARTAINARLAELEPGEHGDRGDDGDEAPVEPGDRDDAAHPILRVDPDGDDGDEVPDEVPALERLADALDGVEVFTDEAASHAARAAVREAEHGAPVIDASELDRRLAAAPDASARNAVALDPEVLRAAAAMDLADDTFGAAELRRVVKAHKVSLGAWDDGVRRAVEAQRAAEDAKADEAQRKAAALRREAFEAERAAKAAAIETRRREAGEDLAGFVDTFETAGGITFEMEPGEMSAEVPTLRPDGTPGRAKVHHLMDAAARIVSVIEEQEQPDAEPAALFRVAFAPRHGAPFTVDVPSTGFDACAWITPATRGRVTVSPGREVRDLIRAGICTTAKAAPTVRRRAFLGWVHDAGRWMRLHASGAIDASGAVEGAEVRAPEPRLLRYAQPAPPTGEARADALDALRELATLEPARAVLPVVAFVVRSLVGPGAGICHVHASAQTGKSHLCALALCLAGEGFEGPRSHPGEWERDTANFTAKVLSVAGDTPWSLDDWRPGVDPGGARFLEVSRAVFNMSGRGALNRGRGFNATVDPRGSVLSTGEALATGGSFSGLSRVLAVELSEKVSLPGGDYAPQDGDEEPERAFTMRAPEHLARAGALLVQWLAARLDTWRDPAAPAARKRLVAEERAALARWGVKESARAVDVIGPVALGAEILCAFLRDTGAMSTRDLAALGARVRDALGALAGDRRDTLAQHAPGRAFVDALALALRTGAAHAVVVRANKIVEDKPDGARHMGWRLRNGAWETQGALVAHLDARHPGALCVDPDAAIAVVTEATRRAGRPAEIATKEHLSRELAAAGLLAERESAKRATVRDRVDGSDRPRLVVKLSAFGFTSDDSDDTDRE